MLIDSVSFKDYFVVSKKKSVQPKLAKFNKMYADTKHTFASTYTKAPNIVNSNYAMFKTLVTVFEIDQNKNRVLIPKFG